NNAISDRTNAGLGVNRRFLMNPPWVVAPALSTLDEQGQAVGLWFTRSMPTLRYVVADVFTDTPLTGNQLAVFTDAREIPEDKLQPLARELNVSETVFVYPASAASLGHARIRIFTPTLELPFAGHPILGT